MELKEFFEQNPRVAIAFSGGVDSSYLCYAAKKYARQCRAYYVKGEFQPEFEYRDAVKLASIVGIELRVINASVLSDENVSSNPSDRCYHCKNMVFSVITDAAKEDGFDVIIDGTNASDDPSDRPGVRALKERGVLSPLRDCGLTKNMIRELSKEAGLFTWNKPSYACLATRIPTGERITPEKLSVTEEAEGILMEMGFSGFRVRYEAGRARIELPGEQRERFMEKADEINTLLRRYYKSVSLDLEARHGE